VASADGMGVVIVVPAFAAGEHGDPEAVAGIVAGFEAAAAPEMGGGVDQPGGVQAEGNAEEDAPEDHLDAAHEAVVDPTPEAKEDRPAGDERDPVVLAHPDVEAVAGEIGNVAGEGLVLACMDLPRTIQPMCAHQGLRFGSVRIAGLVAVLMMNAVDSNPEDRSAFERERGADSEEVFNPLGSLEAAMREQAVIADADAEVDGQDPKDGCDCQTAPTEVEERGDCADVEGGDKAGGDPIDATVVGFAAHATSSPTGVRVAATCLELRLAVIRVWQLRNRLPAGHSVRLGASGGFPWGY
jgi:hypothetical protein